MDVLLNLIFAIYIILILFRTENADVYRSILGISVILALFIFLRDLKKEFKYSKKRIINRLHLYTLSFSFIILISILFSKEINGDKFIALLRYISPLLIAAAFSSYYIDDIENQKKLFSILSGILFVFFVASIIRLSLVRFNISDLMLERRYLWDEKMHTLGQMYAGIIILLFTISVVNKLPRWHLFFFSIPILSIGARSVMIGTFIFLVIYFFEEIRRSKFRKLLFFLFLGGVLSYLGYISDFSNLQHTFLRVFASEGDLIVNNQNITIDSFSSGRLSIWSSYLSIFTLSNFLLGTGLLYYDSQPLINFRLHNDLFESFFSFGLVGFIFIVYFLYYKFIIKSINLIDVNKRIYFYAFCAYFFIVSLTNSLLDYQSTALLYLALVLLSENK